MKTETLEEKLAEMERSHRLTRDRPVGRSAHVWNEKPGTQVSNTTRLVLHGVFTIDELCEIIDFTKH